MKLTSRKLLAMLLVLCIMVSLLPMAVLAAGETTLKSLSYVNAKQTSGAETVLAVGAPDKTYLVGFSSGPSFELVMTAEPTDPDAEVSGDTTITSVGQKTITVTNGGAHSDYNFLFEKQSRAGGVASLAFDVTEPMYVALSCTATSLTMGAEGSLAAAEGYTLTVTDADGAPVELTEGSYENITLTVAAEAEPEPEPGTEPDPEPSTTVEYTEDTVLSESVSCGKLIIADGVSVTAAEGKSLTLTVDGVAKNIEAGKTYEGDVRLNVTDQFIHNYAKGNNSYDYEFRQALFLENGTVVDEKSVLPAAQNYSGEDLNGITIESENDLFNGITAVSGEYTIDGLTAEFNAHGGNDFDGFGSVITAIGDGTDAGTTKLRLNNANITTKGYIMPALVSINGAEVIITNSRFSAESGILPEWYLPNAMPGFMWNCPWMLGLNGNVRTTNMVGPFTRTTYINSEVISKNWGALSTDDGSDETLTVIDSKISNAEGSESGYGAYAIGNRTIDQFYGAEFDVATYGTISIGGACYFDDATEANLARLKADLGLSDADLAGVTTGKATTVNSGRFGWMCHEKTTASAIVRGNTTFNTGEAVFIFRGVPGYVDVEGEGVTLNPANGTILQVMDLDKANKNSTTAEDWEGAPEDFVNAKLSATTKDYKEPVASYDEIVYESAHDVYTVDTEGRDYTAEGYYDKTWKDAYGKYTDTTLTGNFYNGTTGDNSHNNTGMTKNNWDHGWTANLALDFVGTDVTGVISSSYVNHIDRDSGEVVDTIKAISVHPWQDAEFYNVGRVQNTVMPAVNNGVIVTLDADSTWTVTGTSYLTSLTVGDPASIQAKDGQTVTVKFIPKADFDAIRALETGREEAVMAAVVAAETLTLEAGTTYEGLIILTVSDNPGNNGGNENPPVVVNPQPQQPEQPAEWVNPFVDVAESDWFFDGVKFAAMNGIMKGVSADHFAPTADATRAMSVTCLYRMAKAEPVGGSSEFLDVEDGVWYTDAILWASANGIVNGYGNGYFGVNDGLTREMLITILYRYAAFAKHDVSAAGDLSAFTDGDQVSDWAQDAVRWAVGVGLLIGDSNHALNAGDVATRAQLATVFERFQNLLEQ